MTREEVKEHTMLMKSKWVELDLIEVIDMIYDDFESRVCENCKYAEKIIGCPCCHHGFMCKNKSVIMYHAESMRVSSDFGCNKFERK